LFVKSRLITVLAASAAVAFVPSTALAQRQPQPTPEQRIDRLERQVQQMQRQVFPKGRPADTAGFADDPAATQSSVLTLDQRLDALEKQMADLVRTSEDNGSRLRSVEAGLGQLKNDEDQRISALEQRMTAAPAPVVGQTGEAAPTTPAEKAKSTLPKKLAESTPAAESSPAQSTGTDATQSDPGEDAYSQGFHLWEAGQYDQSIAALKSFLKAYPNHRRVSYANNLIGRAYLDKGDARSAAAAFLSNYRTNPSGERAQDSLYYLAQSLMKLGQPSQACKAYAEMDAVYGAKIRPDLKKLESDGKAQAQCN
jgi:TolA-binding protein